MKNVKLTTKELNAYFGDTETEKLPFDLLEKCFYIYADEAQISTAEQFKSNPELKEIVYPTYISVCRSHILDRFEKGEIKIELDEEEKESNNNLEKDTLIKDIVKNFFNDDIESIDKDTRKLLNRFAEYAVISAGEKRREKEEEEEEEEENLGETEKVEMKKGKLFNYFKK